MRALIIPKWGNTDAFLVMNDYCHYIGTLMMKTEFLGRSNLEQYPLITEGFVVMVQKKIE